MTQTRYISDLLATTESGYLGLTDYVRDMKIAADHAGLNVLHTHEAIVCDEFSQIMGDMHERFHSTLGIFKALVALAAIQPDESLREHARALLAAAVEDYDAIYDEGGEAQWDGDDADEPAVIIKRLQDQFSAAVSRCAGVLAMLTAAPEFGAVLSRGMLDYEMLMEQCAAWLAEIDHARTHGIPDVGAIRFGRACANRDAFTPAQMMA